MIIKKEIYAKPGELMQGRLPDGQNFLLSNKSSKCFKSTTQLSTAITNSSTLAFKSEQAKNTFWERLPHQKKNVPLSELMIEQQSNIPVGKGLGSSSADVLGILYVLNNFYGDFFSKAELYQMACSVEPTDPAADDAPLFFNQHRGYVISSLPLLPYRIIYFDSLPGMTISTCEFLKNYNYKRETKIVFHQLCQNILMAFRMQNYALFFQCIMKSAEINQEFLIKPKFNILKEFAVSRNCGLFVAHSGTYMGLVMEPSRFDAIADEAKDLIMKHWNTSFYID